MYIIYIYSYVSWFVASIFGVPLLIICICYGIICHQIWIYSQSALPPPPLVSTVQQPVETRLTVSTIRRWFLLASLRWQKSRSNAANKSSGSANSSLSAEAIPMRIVSTNVNQSAATTNNQAAFAAGERNSSFSRRSRQQNLMMPLRRSNTERIGSAKIKTIKLTLVVTFCFVACWAPFCVTQLVMVYWPPGKFDFIYFI